ncbi:MAG: hypothetical protein ACL9RN_04340 [Cylindrospermopsis raciborskii]|uniref:hypothetical protein n=1 Tax=Cylindrospermopsis raciborskii TaxID=77022 RepID=UPI003D11E001
MVSAWRSHLVYEFEEGDQWCGKNNMASNFRFYSGTLPPPPQLIRHATKLLLAAHRLLGRSGESVHCNL